MLVGPRGFALAKKNKRELIVLFISGVLLAMLMTIFSCIYVGYEVSWFNLVHSKSSADQPIIRFKDFITALNAESTARVKTPGDVASAAAATNTAFDSFFNTLTSLQTKQNVEDAFQAYRATTSTSNEMGGVLAGHITVVEASSVALFRVIYQALSPRPMAATSMLVAEAVTAAYTSAGVRANYLHSTQFNLPAADQDYITAEQASQLAVQMAVLTSTKRIGDAQGPTSFTRTKASLLSSLSDPPQEILTASMGFQVAAAGSDTVVMPTALESLGGLLAFLSSRQQIVTASGKTQMRSIVLMAIGGFLSLVAMVAACCICVRHCNRLRPTSKLAETFESSRHHDHLRLQYMPLLQELRAVALPTGRKARYVSAVEREYLIAARAVDAMRVAMPQLLLANSLALRRSVALAEEEANPAAAAAVNSEEFPLLGCSAKLDLGPALCRRAVVMEFNLTLTRAAKQHTQRRVEEDYAVISSLFHLIVEEVNRSGGVFVGFRDGIGMVCAWNLLSSGGEGLTKEQENVLTGEAIAAAIRVSWIVHYRAMKEERLLVDPEEGEEGEYNANGLRPIAHLWSCIVSGLAVSSNEFVAGDRLHATLEGTMFSNLDSMRLVGKSASSHTLIDGPSQRRLLTTWERHSCKPLMVVKNANRTGPLTIFSAAEEDGEMTSDQSVLYNAAFALYQNSMVKEAVNEFRRYLALYPGDKRAMWLMSHILLPKQSHLASSF